MVAAEMLVTVGFTNVWNLKEGMNDWVAKGYQLVRKSP
jgi:rhodanese-related sulfurtransferase